jgi:hypothetical protein
MAEANPCAAVAGMMRLMKFLCKYHTLVLRLKYCFKVLPTKTQQTKVLVSEKLVYSHLLLKKVL